MDEQVFWCWPNLFPRTQKATFVALDEEIALPLVIKQMKRNTMSTFYEKV